MKEDAKWKGARRICLTGGLVQDRVGSKGSIILKCLTEDQSAAGVYLLVGTIYEHTAFIINCQVYHIFS